ncbi:hypothetical protein MTR_6g074895 [Medicago truncatula]|uniref:Uncharacterized protein n=1 Tax=Medicago truncatula TaxID=3880 RepID=A0A072UAY3_MEDTR|nr:hypothetical protein MTR_6g074895 [Medicago truncatula]
MKRWSDGTQGSQQICPYKEHQIQKFLSLKCSQKIVVVSTGPGFRALIKVHSFNFHAVVNLGPLLSDGSDYRYTNSVFNHLNHRFKSDRLDWESISISTP